MKTNVAQGFSLSSNGCDQSTLAYSKVGRAGDSLTPGLSAKYALWNTFHQKNTKTTQLDRDKCFFFSVMGNNHSSHISFESDGDEGITFVKGIRVSAQGMGGGEGRKFSFIVWKHCLVP